MLPTKFCIFVVVLLLSNAIWGQVSYFWPFINIVLLWHFLQLTSQLVPDFGSLSISQYLYLHHNHFCFLSICSVLPHPSLSLKILSQSLPSPIWMHWVLHYHSDIWILFQFYYMFYYLRKRRKKGYIWRWNSCHCIFRVKLSWRTMARYKSKVFFLLCTPPYIMFMTID